MVRARPPVAVAAAAAAAVAPVGVALAAAAAAVAPVAEVAPVAVATSNAGVTPTRERDFERGHGPSRPANAPGSIQRDSIYAQFEIVSCVPATEWRKGA